jgi:hypothetical protein
VSWATATVWTNLKWHVRSRYGELSSSSIITASPTLLVFSLNACEISLSLSELCQGSLQGDIDPLLRGALRRVPAHHERGGFGGDDEDDSNSDHMTLQQQVALLKKQLQDSGQEPVEFVELAVARQRMQDAVCPDY